MPKDGDFMKTVLKNSLVIGVSFLLSLCAHAKDEQVVQEKAPQLTIAEQIAQKEHEIEKVKKIMSKQRQEAQRSVENASDVLEREAGRFATRRQMAKLPDDYEDLEGWDAAKEKATVVAQKTAYVTAEYAAKGAQLFLDYVVHPLAVHPKSVKQLWKLGALEKDEYFLRREQEKKLKGVEENPAVGEKDSRVGAQVNAEEKTSK